MKKIIVKYILLAIESVLLFIVIGAITTAITKNIYADILIESFKSKAILDEENSSYNTKIYRVDSNEERPTYQKIGNNYYPGDEGDILISLNSELDILFVKEFVSFFAGGHAGIVLGSYSDYYLDVDNSNTVESTGLNNGDNVAEAFNKNYWSSGVPYQEIICLRVNTTEAQRKRVTARAISLLGDPYNYSFIYDVKNKSYCSYLVAKAYSSVGIDLNKDGFTTSVYDLLVSSETYISYYQYIDSDNVKHIYFLD